MARELAASASTIDELNGLLRGLMKSALERMPDAEMDVHLERQRQEPPLPFEPPAPNNRRNGRSKKTVQGELGEINIAVPRDRDGSFEPVLLGKCQRRLAGFDEKVLALYAKGLTTRDVQDIVPDLYGLEVSPTLISEVVA